MVIQTYLPFSVIDSRLRRASYRLLEVRDLSTPTPTLHSPLSRPTTETTAVVGQIIPLTHRAFWSDYFPGETCDVVD